MPHILLGLYHSWKAKVSLSYPYILFHVKKIKKGKLSYFWMIEPLFACGLEKFTKNAVWSFVTRFCYFWPSFICAGTLLEGIGWHMLNVVIFGQVTLVAGTFLKGEDYTCCRHNCNFKLSKARASPTVDSQNRGKCQLLQPSTIRGNYRA